MPVDIHAPGPDQFDLAVDYGGLTYSMFFGDGPHRTPLPGVPPPRGDQCLCPSCQSQGWYAQSPVCKFWRAHCYACHGSRFYRDFSHGRPPRRTACDLCAEEWAAAVEEFRRVLGNPAAAARRLRAQARSRQVLEEGR